MNDLKSILDIIQRPFSLEKKTRYQDKAVFGGLGAYVASWVTKAIPFSKSSQIDQLKKLSYIFEDYSEALPSERKLKLEESIKIIEQLQNGEILKQNNVEKADTIDQTPIPKDENDDLELEDQNIETMPEIQITDEADKIVALSTPIEYVKGIGPKRSELLMKEISIRTVGDLMEYYPRDYHDRSRFKSIYQVGRSGDYETIQGIVVNQLEITPRRAGAQKFLKVIVYDETAVASMIAFGKRIQYMKQSLKLETKLVVSGKFKRDYGEIQTSEYTYEILSDEDAELIHTGRIVPVYPLTANLIQRSLRRWVKSVLDNYVNYVQEILPSEIRNRLQLIDKQEAVKNIHFPDSEQNLKAARHRLAFDELLLLELGLGVRKKRWEIEEPGISFKEKTDLLKRFVKSLPFQLTSAQKKAFAEIKKDMESPRPLNRLLQGDVGSGKTVVAAMAMLLAVDNEYQSALMAPTEILAEQHYNTLTNLLEPLGIKVVLLRGDMHKKERDKSLIRIKTGEANIVVGTHAIIQSGVEFANLGLAIIDEQHRFGVMQRAELKNKGVNPDVLVMTATPIPRTLALTVYGDFNISVIDQLPPGRQKIATHWVPEGKRKDMYKFIESQIAEGRQAYLVYPLVEESEKLEDLKAATEMAEHFQNEVFPHLKVGLIHGRMKSDEKQEIMTKFKNNEINILVSTTVIEVGIDVPNASLMLIEHAERFGLAQLHQLRGRVGRSSHKSYCMLIADPSNEDAVRRVKAMERTNNGFEIAEEDLAIRGPGEFFGTKQAGMPDLKVANLIIDAKLLEIAREEAFQIATDDPGLIKPEHQMLKKILREKWQQNLEMISIG